MATLAGTSRSRFILGGAAVVAAVWAMPAWATDIIQNGGFETGTGGIAANWNNQSATTVYQDNTNPHTGSFDEFFNNVGPGAGNVFLFQDTAAGSVSPGDNFTLSFYSANNLFLGGEFQYQVIYFSAASGPVYFSGVKIATPSPGPTTYAQTTFAIPAAAPANSDHAEIQFFAVNSANAGSFSKDYLDDVSFTKAGGGGGGPTVAQWGMSGGGSWATAGNWSPTTAAPNGAAAQANFLSGPGLTAAGIITLDGNETVGRMTFANNSAGSSPTYTIAPGTPSNSTLTINDTGGSPSASPSITVNSGFQDITAPISLTNNVTITTAASSGLTLGGAVGGSGTITANGAGTLVVDTTGSLNLPLQANGNVTFAAHNGGGLLTQTVPSLNVGASGVVTVADLGQSNHANRTVLVAGALSITSGGVLDLEGNDLIVHNSLASNITPYLTTGFNAGSGYWNGTGIRSSTAAGDSTFLTALGVVQNINTAGNAPLYTTFDGVSGLTTSDVLVKYTYYGDANLDGTVDGNDYTAIDANNGVTSGATWAMGDFNYDGKVDGSDYSLIDNAFNQQGSGGLADPLAAVASSIATSAAVPEPGSVAVLMIAAGMTVRRRRR
jgi:hypothetical protein